jgi:hypothetical protein
MCIAYSFGFAWLHFSGHVYCIHFGFVFFGSLYIKVIQGYIHDDQEDLITLKVDDVLQQMKTRCRNELTLVPAIYEEQLVKLRHTEWNEETKQLVEHMHVQLFSSVEASRLYS